MLRFKLNRRLTFILALGVSLVLTSSFFHSRAVADGTPGMVGDPDPVGPTGSGDPDDPVGPQKGRNGRLARGSTELGKRPAGDGRITSGVSVWRLRVVLQGLRSFYLRF